MNTFFKLKLGMVLLLATVSAAFAQQITESPETRQTMKTYLIEREIAGAGDLTEVQLQEISQTSNNVINEIGPGIKWLHSYVTENKVFCVYQAESKELIETHAQKGGFPADAIREVNGMLGPQKTN